MKWTGFLFLILLVACENKKPQASANPRPYLAPRDSGVIVQDSTNAYSPVDLSPMDMSWLPIDYPIKKLSGGVMETPVARVIYSRPQRQGRKIFGSHLKYGAPWRMGANEGTELEVFKPMKLGGKTLAPGKYILYCIPQQDTWTVAVNRNLYSWGLNIDPSQDVFRVEIPIQNVPRPLEYFTMVFQGNNGGFELVMAWDTVVARLPVSY